MQIKSLFFFFTLITIATCFADETKKIFVVSPQAAHHDYTNSEQRPSLSIPIGPVNISVDLVRSVCGVWINLVFSQSGFLHTAYPVKGKI